MTNRLLTRSYLENAPEWRTSARTRISRPLQDDGVRRVGRGTKVTGVTRQELANAPQMPFDGHGTFGEKLRVEFAHLR